VIVLIQSGKSGGLGGIFGGGSNEALFSAPSGSTFIRKLTVGFAIAFICTTLLLTILGSRKHTRSVIQRVPIPGNQ
jgi:preprotein translocase subunit SecG